MNGKVPKHEVAQIAATSHVAAGADGHGAQTTTCFSMEPYSTTAILRGRSRGKKALQQLQQTKGLVDSSNESGLPWAEDNAIIRKKILRHVRNSAN